jgi:16S rRNA A1518/A1519 N6-dimethyltransferase RsmA/KsgA/DIM1 with predicted DNA glycosylase/AP lyase activity
MDSDLLEDITTHDIVQELTDSKVVELIQNKVNEYDITTDKDFQKAFFTCFNNAYKNPETRFKTLIDLIPSGKVGEDLQKVMRSWLEDYPELLK